MNNFAPLEVSNLLTLQPHKYPQLKTHFDAKHKTSWCYMNANPRPCFTPDLLNSFKEYTSDIKQEMHATNGDKYDFIVLASDIEGIFNLGGDLDLFTRCIQAQDHAALKSYATACIDVLYENISHLNENLTTISLVQGDALGGGFESALASNIMVAEKGVKMGLPEVLFNLFPGMGAYTLLSRKIGPSKAEKLIMSGELYSSEDLYDMGIVDILAEKGEGEIAVYKYIKSANRADNTFKAMRKVKDITSNISYSELKAISDIWVNAALNLTSKDLRMINRLIKTQNNKMPQY